MGPLLEMHCRCPQEKCLAQNFHEFLSAADVAEFLELYSLRQVKKNFQTNSFFQWSI